MNRVISSFFIDDTVVDAKRIELFTIIDDFIRKNLMIMVDTLLNGHRIKDELEKFIEIRGISNRIVRDNEIEFTSAAILKSNHERKVR